jgi:PilZ domain-containing protein
LFGLFGPEKVEFLDIYDTTLTYRSKKKKHTPGSVSKISLQVFLEDAIQSLKLEVVVDSARQLPDKSYLIVSHILGQPEQVSQLTMVLSEAPKPDIGKLARRSERIPIGLRVLSQQLPGFRAVTVDISLHGTQIMCEGHLEQGAVMDVTFELNLNDCPRLTLRGVVVWCAEGEERRKSFRGGLEFTEQHPETQALWNKSYAQLLRMQSGSVMHRSMSAEFD